jgi:uncharacterized coiled-coil protein SlyX
MGLTKAQLEALNVSSFPNNNTGLITPEILRDYNSASIANTVNQDAYTTDSASFNSRIDSIVTGTGFVTTSSFNAYTSSNDSKVNSLINATASYANSASVASVNNAQQAQINSLIAFTGSNTNTSLNSYTSSNDTKWSNLGAQTGSFITESETGSFATSAITASSLITASISGQTLTFTKGDASTFGVIIPTGSGGGTTDITALNAFTASQLTINAGYNTTTASLLVETANLETFSASTLTRLTNIETTTASLNSSVSQLNANTASQQSQINALISATASYAISSSVAAVDAAQQSQINSLIAATGSYSTSSVSLTSLNAYTQSNDIKWSNLGGQSGSWITESETGSFANATTFNQYTSSNDSKVNSLISATGSYAISASVALVDANQQSQINALIAVTASFLTSSADITSLNAFTASQLDINSGYNTFTQSADQRLDSIESVSGSWITESETASFARTNIDNNFTANQTFTNITAVSASFTYVQTLYETSSVIYSSGSNQFGDELIDIQTLSGSVKVQGSLTVNGTPVLTSSVDISGLVTTSSFNAYTQSNNQRVSSLETNSASVNTSITNINTATASLFTSASLGLTTASFSGNTLTFTKGDASTFGIVIPDTSGSAGTTLIEVVYTGESITKGDPLYISGSQGANPRVFKADAADPLKMPVTFVSNETIGAANTTNAIVLGLIEGIDLTGYVAGQTIYVAEGGGWSINLPSGSNSITQLLGVVTKGGAGGKGLVLNPGPAQLPGLDTGKMWVGNGNNQPIEITTASFASSASFNSYTSSTNSRLTNIETTTASLNSSITQLNEFTESQDVYNNFIANKVGSLEIATGSYATTGSNAFFGTNTFSGAVSFTGSAPSILSQSFSGSLITNLTDIYTDIPAVQQIVTLTSASYAALASGSLTNPNTLYIVSGSTSGTTIDTGSFATTGSNTFTGVNTFNDNVFITASKELRFGDNTSIFKSLDGITGFHTYGGNQTRNFTSGEMLILQEANAQLLIENKAGNIIKISGSATSIQDVDFIPFSSSLDSRINTLNIATGSFATTGSNTFNGNQTITGSLLISSSVAVDLIVTGAMGITGNVTSSGSNGQVVMSNVAINITSNAQSSSALYGRNIMRQNSGSNAMGMAANPAQGNWVSGVTDPSIISFSGSAAVGNYYAPIRFQPGDQYTDGRVNFVTPLSASAGFTASLQDGYAWVGNSLGQNTQVATSSFAAVTIDTGSFATTGSNNFVGNETITGSLTISGSGTNDLSVIGQVFVSSTATGGTTAPKLTVSGSAGQSIINRNSINTRNTTNLSGLLPSSIFTNTTATSDEIGFTVDAAGAGTPNWSTGPAIYVNNTIDTYPAVFGFQNKANYTDGRVTILTPLIAQLGSIITGSLTVSGAVSIQGNTTFINKNGDSSNVILGNNAMSNITGSIMTSIAIGAGAMRYASGSSQNVAIGENALAVTTGTNNFALGNETLANNTTGNQNVAIGVGALNKNTTGAQNTVIGNDAGFFASGSQNTYIGASSGNNITGSNNTILGRYQGSAGETLTNNIILADGSGTAKAQYSGSAWSFQGEIKLNKGSDKPCDIVTVGSGGTTVNNSLVTSNSIILVTTQQLGGTDPGTHPAVVHSKTTGSFVIKHGLGDSLLVAYLIINPTA